MKRPARCVIYQDRANEWRWRLYSGSRIVADSGEGYTTAGHAERAAKRLIVIAATMKVEREQVK